MPNIRLVIAYDGTRYGGWQIQKNARTIQGDIEDALKKILKEKVKLIGASRTDSGVHAKAQVANFHTKNKIPLEKLTSAVNANLSKDISVTSVKEVSPKFHSQFDAKSKLYRYSILNSCIKDPFSKRYSYKVPYKLNTYLMKKEAKVLAGKHDFKAFQAKSDTATLKNTTRRIKKITIKKEKEFIIISIEGTGFLHNMVRNVVGTLIEVGRGYFPEGSMKKILRSRDRKVAGPTAPAEGLMLLKVKY